VTTPQRVGRWPGARRPVAGLLGLLGLLIGLIGITMVAGWALSPGFTPAGELPPSSLRAPVSQALSTQGARSPSTQPTSAPDGTPRSQPAQAPRSNLAGVLADSSFAPQRLRLPALGVDAAVIPVGLEAGGALTIPGDARVIGWWSTGAAPGSPVGTVLMAGHVDSAQTGPGALSRLSQAPIGARITVRGSDSEATYVVQARRRYLKQGLPWGSILAQGERPRLVLVTCGGDFDSRTKHYTDNVVVIATPL
jgi:hypothetical protein